MEDAMTLIERATTRHSAPAPRPRLGALLRWLAAADARHRQRRALARLDDHLLRDIGLDRHVLAREIERPYSAASW
jgi:uncharacterized protein YjiS (DUF1127 family)